MSAGKGGGGFFFSGPKFPPRKVNERPRAHPTRTHPKWTQVLQSESSGREPENGKFLKVVRKGAQKVF